MDQYEFPTKANLIHTQHTLELANQGYVLLDQKRNVLIQEIADLQAKSKNLRLDLNKKLSIAKSALAYANDDMGKKRVKTVAENITAKCEVQVHTKKVMGVEIPTNIVEISRNIAPPYRLEDTKISLDEVYKRFYKVKEVIIKLAAVENAARRLQLSIRKTSKRANALRYITIPKYEARLKFIQDVLEERERDGFIQMKLAKSFNVF